MLVGRGSDKKANLSYWAGAVMPKALVNAEKAKGDRPTDRQTDRPTESRVHAIKNQRRQRSTLQMINIQKIFVQS